MCCNFELIASSTSGCLYYKGRKLDTNSGRVRRFTVIVLKSNSEARWADFVSLLSFRVALLGKKRNPVVSKRDVAASGFQEV